MPLRMLTEEQKDREREARRKAGGRRKKMGAPRGTARKPTPSAGPGSLMNKPKKPKAIVILGTSYDKARKEVEAEGGSPRLKTEDDKAGRILNKMYGNVRGKDEYAFLSGGQAKLDKNKNKKIDAEDFKILRAEKAKGRGQVYRMRK